MKKSIVFLCLFFMALTLHAMGIREDYRAAEEKARVSYAFGMAVGSNFDLASLGIELDFQAFTAGFRAMVEHGFGQFTEEEAIILIENALQDAIDRSMAQNRQREEDFLAANRLRPEVLETESGLQYVIIKETDGERPQPNSIVRVHYAGTFIDGSPFDASLEEDGAFIPLDFVISGWSEGLQLMGVGSRFQFYIPSHLAYGTEGIQGFIAPYSTLIFEVELLEVTAPETETGFYDF